MAVWAVAWFLPAVYRSETVILVEQQKVPETLVVPNVSADLQDQLQNHDPADPGPGSACWTS